MNNEKTQQQSDKLKEAHDNFARLGFMMETFGKLMQTNDHRQIAENCLLASVKDADALLRSITELVQLTFKDE